MLKNTIPYPVYRVCISIMLFNALVKMNRLQIKQHNQAIIALVKSWHKSRHAKRYSFYRFGLRPPKMGYKELAAKLNAEQIQSSRGNNWTFRSLYRMMQRQGVRLIDL